MKNLLMLISLTLFLNASFLPPSAGADSPKLVPKHSKEFVFPGGNLIDFLAVIRTTFEVDLGDIGTIPPAMQMVEVPKMRMGGREGDQLDFRNVLALYNSISEKGNHRLGRWIVEGPLDREAQAVILVNDGPEEESAYSVRAFALPTTNEEETIKLVQSLSRTIEKQQQVIITTLHHRMNPDGLDGRIDFHPETGILVASGGPRYVQLASEIIEAVRQKQQTKGPAAPGAAKRF